VQDTFLAAFPAVDRKENTLKKASGEASAMVAHELKEMTAFASDIFPAFCQDRFLHSGIPANNSMYSPGP